MSSEVKSEIYTLTTHHTSAASKAQFTRTRPNSSPAKSDPMASIQNLPQSVLSNIFNGLIGRKPLPPALETAAPIIRNPHTGVLEREITLLQAESARDTEYARYLKDDQLSFVRELVYGDAVLMNAARIWILGVQAHQFVEENFRLRSHHMANMYWFMMETGMTPRALTRITSIKARWVHETPPSYISPQSAFVDSDAAPDVFCFLHLNCSRLTSLEMRVSLYSLKHFVSNGERRMVRLWQRSDFEGAGFDELRTLKQVVESRPAHHVSVQDISTSIGQSLDDWLA